MRKPFRALCLVCKDTTVIDRESLETLGLRGCICLNEKCHTKGGTLVQHPLSRHVNDELYTGDITVGSHILITNLGKLKGAKTNVYGVFEKDMLRDKYHPHALLGSIAWFGRWRKYAFCPAAECTFEEVCMEEISLFIREETRAHMAQARAKRKAAKA
jgi:hypothetical protein